MAIHRLPFPLWQGRGAAVRNLSIVKYDDVAHTQSSFTRLLPPCLVFHMHRLLVVSIGKRIFNYLDPLLTDLSIEISMLICSVVQDASLPGAHYSYACEQIINIRDVWLLLHWS